MAWQKDWTMAPPWVVQKGCTTVDCLAVLKAGSKAVHWARQMAQTTAVYWACSMAQTTAVYWACSRAVPKAHL